MHDQQVAVQWTLHLQRISFFDLLTLMVRTQCNASFVCILYISARNAHLDSCPLEVKPHRPYKCVHVLASCMLSVDHVHLRYGHTH